MIYIYAYIDACSLMCFGHNNIFHFLCECVLLLTEPHHPWKDLLGAVYHTNPHTHRVRSNTTGPTAVLITSVTSHLQLSLEHESPRLLLVRSRHLLPYCSVAVQPKPLASGPALHLGGGAVCAHTVVLLVCVTHERVYSAVDTTDCHCQSAMS